MEKDSLFCRTLVNMLRDTFIIVSLLMVVILSSCQGAGKGNTGKTAGADSTQYAELTFEKVFHDFGQIMEGETVSCLMKYKNTGTVDLVIRNAETSCGCTVSRWSKSPLKPGGEDKIEVIFDSSGRIGKQYKTITILSNARNNPVRLNITGEVITKQ